ncbi:hypothetical protein EJB05_32557, partial [Eragrostis curvula]
MASCSDSVLHRLFHADIDPAGTFLKFEGLHCLLPCEVYAGGVSDRAESGQVYTKLAYTIKEHREATMLLDLPIISQPEELLKEAQPPFYLEALCLMINDVYELKNTYKLWRKFPPQTLLEHTVIRHHQNCKILSGNVWKRTYKIPGTATALDNQICHVTYEMC